MVKPSEKRPARSRFRSLTMHVMVSAEEKETLLRASAVVGTPLSVFARAAALEKARKLLKTVED